MGDGKLLAIVACGHHEHQAMVLWTSDDELDQDVFDFDGDPYGCGTRLSVADHLERVYMGQWSELGAELLLASHGASDTHAVDVSDFEDAPTLEVTP